MKLPLLLSVPHAGVKIPADIQEICLLTRQEVEEDSDEEADEIYFPLKEHVAGFVTTPIARAIIDMNRDIKDRRKDGIVKTHTCWNNKIYSEPLSTKQIQKLIDQYYVPYHQKLTKLSAGAVLGVDCHTMAMLGPPVGPDPWKRRPYICLSNGDGTCSEKTLMGLALSLEEAFGFPVSINKPFKGGYIIKKHAPELPWIQVEFSRAGFMDNSEKSSRFYSALKKWLKQDELSATGLSEDPGPGELLAGD